MLRKRTAEGRHFGVSSPPCFFRCESSFCLSSGRNSAPCLIDVRNYGFHLHLVFPHYILNYLPIKCVNGAVCVLRLHVVDPRRHIDPVFIAELWSSCEARYSRRTVRHPDVLSRGWQLIFRVDLNPF